MRKVRLAKLRGTPGLKEERITEAEREVAEAEARVGHASFLFIATIPLPRPVL